MTNRATRPVHDLSVDVAQDNGRLQPIDNAQRLLGRVNS